MAFYEYYHAFNCAAGSWFITLKLQWCVWMYISFVLLLRCVIVHSETEKKATLDQALRGVLEEQIVSPCVHYLLSCSSWNIGMYAIILRTSPMIAFYVAGEAESECWRFPFSDLHQYRWRDWRYTCWSAHTVVRMKTDLQIIINLSCLHRHLLCYHSFPSAGRRSRLSSSGSVWQDLLLCWRKCLYMEVCKFGAFSW